jgi:hypothetical protein
VRDESAMHRHVEHAAADTHRSSCSFFAAAFCCLRAARPAGVSEAKTWRPPTLLAAVW